MTVYTAIFYLLAAAILMSTAIAVTRHNLVHAVVYLILSFFGTAMLFYLLGAPLLAALEVIIYAGAIMILFLFIIMMMKAQSPEPMVWTPRHGLPPIMFILVYVIVGVLFTLKDSGMNTALIPAVAVPSDFGKFLFQRHWLTVEIVSLLLLIALLGAIRLGKPSSPISSENKKEKSP